MTAVLRLGGLMLWLALVVLASCGLVYGILQLAPGDESSLGAAASHRDFAGWIWSAARGDLGESSSYRAGAEVSELLRAAIMASARLVGLALVLVVSGGMTLAWMWHGRSASVGANATRTIVYLVSSMPAFLLAYWAIVGINAAVAPAVNNGQLRRPDWFPLPVDNGNMRYFIAAFVLAVGSGTLMEAARGYKAELDRITQADFILFARSTGAPVWAHILPSMVAPFLTMTVNRLTAIFGEAVVIETIFNISGLGRLTWEASLKRDWRVLLGTTLVWTGSYALARLASAFISTMVDPRQRTAAAENA